MSPDQATEEFLQLMHKETGVSWYFLNNARPIIRRAFTDVLKEELQVLLDQIAGVIAQHAEIEKSYLDSKTELDKTKKNPNITDVQLLNTQDLFGSKTKDLIN